MLALPLTGSTPELYHGKYVAGMYGSGEQGVWYEPSLSNGTLFQDAAGTTPVTAVEQPVGLMKDKSGRGNHAKQTTSADRPVFSARYNLLTATEDLTNWPRRANVTIVKNTIETTDPLGSNTAFKYSSPGPLGYLGQSINVLPGQSFSLSFYAKKGLSNDNPRYLAYNASTNQIIKSVYYGSLLNNSSWTLISVTFTVPNNCFSLIVDLVWDSGIINGIYLWHPQVVPANQASLPYQRVNTATDYDADPVKFPPYLKFNGTNSWMVTNSIDFTGTDKMTVFAGLRKLSDAAVGIIAESSTNSGAAYGAMLITASVSGTAAYSWRSCGTNFADITSPASFAAPISSVVTGIGDIAGDNSAIRINGTQVAQNTADQGTGNYGKYPLYIGRRAGTACPFNGNLHSLIIRGAATDDAHLTHTEKFIAYKTGVSL